MAKHERGMWDTFKRNLGPGVHAVRIESWAGRGVPDTNLCYKSRDVWMELKVASRTGLVDMRAEQVGWLIKRSQAEGACGVLAQWKDLWVWIPGHLFRLLDFKTVGKYQQFSLVDAGVKWPEVKTKHTAKEMIHWLGLS